MVVVVGATVVVVVGATVVVVVGATVVVVVVVVGATVVVVVVGATSEENACFTCDAGSYSDVEGATQCTLCQSGTFQKDSGMSKCDDLRTCSSKQYSSNEALATVSGSTIDRLRYALYTKYRFLFKW